MNTMQAAKGVNLKMIAKESRPPRVIATGVTGDDGITFIKMDDGQNNDSVIVGERSGHTAYGSGGYWYGGDDNLTTYFYTDRPVYRLGQTVMFKGIARQLEADGFDSIGEGENVRVVIEDPSNVQLYSGTVTTSKFGTFNGTFEIPENGKTGNYSVKLTYDYNGKTDYQYFEVDQYRKPEYKIEIKPATERITAGTKARAILNATYFFGGPVANAKVKYSVYSSSDYSLRYKLQPRPDYYSYFDDWEGSGEYDYGGTFVSEGIAQTDENGQAVIEFETTKIQPDTSTPNYYYDYSDKKFKIEAEVTDISRLTSTGAGNLSVTAGNFALFVDPVSYVVQAGEGVKAKIEARDYQGKPMVNQKINMKITRWPFNATTGSHDKEVVVSSGEVTTDSEGKVDFSANVGTQWPTDTFYIMASAKDANGNTVADSSSVWVASPDYPYSLSASQSQKEAFKVSMDKKIYKPGEKARVIISGPFNGKEGYDALVTIEGTTLYSHRIVKLNATANLIEIPIEKKYAPNVFIGVCLVTKKKQFYSSSEMIMVSPNNHFLNIAVETDKKKYKPGEVAKYTLKATYEDGKPAPETELSLGVVDASIYSIRAEQARDIRKVFYAQRSNRVNTFCTFPETYSGGPDKTAVEPKLRKNFKDTAAWFPRLVTDKNGIASAQVTLPDNLTTWRATVRGVTMTCDVGSNTRKSW
ncbi:MAG: hypothetical protein K2X93_08995 [Candidatus Obscuribacterales bacterium]|nr:hypothetical protein [Candidatus Obscuribacterales bacterium]